MALKPANMSFEQAATVPIAAVTALQALRDQGHLKAGQKVLINGASGGVGTFAVQIAKQMKAEVTGVCSGRNTAMVQSIGADHVIDYTHEDFTKAAVRYDLIVDAVGSHSISDYRRVLTPRGVLVIVGGPSDGAWLGPMSSSVKAMVVAPFVDQRLVSFFLAQLNKEDLEVLGGMMEAGQPHPGDRPALSARPDARGAELRAAGACTRQGGHQRRIALRDWRPSGAACTLRCLHRPRPPLWIQHSRAPHGATPGAMSCSP